MKNITINFKDEEEKRDLVLREDSAFQTRIEGAVNSLGFNYNVRVVTVAGPTCSGKTTTAEMLDAALEKSGRRVHTISLDDFFLSRAELLERAEKTGAEIDFDSPDTLDMTALSRVIEAAFSGDRILVPRFDFHAGKRNGTVDFGCPRPEDVYRFEGIQAVYPSVTELFARHSSRSVFLDVGEEATYDHMVFTSNEIRFLRRLVRDSRFRNAEPEFTFRLWETVRANEEKNIFPYSDACDVKITTYHAYEINMLRDEAIAHLSTIAPDSKWYGTARDLIARLTPIPAIPSSYLSERSLFHEFFG